MRNRMTPDRFRHVFVAYIVYASAKTLLLLPAAAARRAGA
jgi:hypothetical protein